MRRMAPSHLRPETRAWWRAVVADFELEEHHVKVLTMAAEAWDRAVEARERVADEGAFYRDRFGAPKSHPALVIERDCRLSFARLLRELNLDGQEPPDVRPPRIGGRS